jgi:hypothetical protein
VVQTISFNFSISNIVAINWFYNEGGGWGGRRIKLRGQNKIKEFNRVY